MTKIKPNYRRINKMTPEELQEMHRKIYNSARIHEDSSKYQKKKERQKKQKSYDDSSFYLLSTVSKLIQKFVCTILSARR